MHQHKQPLNSEPRYFPRPAESSRIVAAARFGKPAARGQGLTQRFQPW